MTRIWRGVNNLILGGLRPPVIPPLSISVPLAAKYFSIFLLCHRTVLSFIRTIPEIILLGHGSHTVKRIPVFSFLVRHPRGVFLHHNFVCAVLNDVFGIQARGGLPCAEPYAHDLLGIDEKLSASYDEELARVK